MGTLTFFMIMKFATKAITNITDITIALTNHVVPKILANSVIHFVSISINPAPKKIIGVFKQLLHEALLVPTSKKDKNQYKVEINNIKAQDGELVEARLRLNRGKNKNQGVDLIRTLGDPTEQKLASMIAIQEHEIPDLFSSQIKQEALQQDCEEQ